MKNILIAILFSSCAATGQTSYDRKQDTKILQLQTDVSILKAQVQSLQNSMGAIQSSFTSLINRMAAAERQILIKDTVIFDTTHFIVSPINSQTNKIYFKP